MSQGIQVGVKEVRIWKTAVDVTKNYLKYVKTPNKTNIMHFLEF